MSSEEYYNYCQRLLNEDSEYLLWLDVMNQMNSGLKTIEKQPKVNRETEKLEKQT